MSLSPIFFVNNVLRIMLYSVLAILCVAIISISLLISDDYF